MACDSWSLPAGPHACAAFSLSGPRPVCGLCYAATGRYRFSNVQRSQASRLQWWRVASLRSRVRTLADAIRGPWFRVFDSGDFGSIADVHAWRAIVRARPDVSFWIPTRAHRLPDYRQALARLHSESNACVRASALSVDGPPAAPDTWLPVSYVTRTGPGCPKQVTKSNCEAAGCRACWDSDVPSVTYREHGGHVVKWSRVHAQREAL